VELIRLAICLFRITVKIPSWETSCAHDASSRSCSALLRMLLVCIRSYQKNFWDISN